MSRAGDDAGVVFVVLGGIMLAVLAIVFVAGVAVGAWFL